MKVKTASTLDCSVGFSGLSWDLSFVGLPIDERTKVGIDFVSIRALNSITARFNIEQPDRLLVGQKLMQRSGLANIFSGKNSVVCEATSLGTVEILFLLRAAADAGLRKIDFIYVEPEEYAKDIRIDMSWSREYSLSESRRLQGVRGFACRLNEVETANGKFVAFLGYEGSRLAQACEQEESLMAWRKYAVFGVPGYAPGWDMNAMANNIDCIARNKFQAIRYCSASSVSNAYDLLIDVHREGRNDSTHTVVAPFGTKPHGIAAAMFLVKNSGYQTTSLIYDHPEKSINRSSKIRRWHLYRISI